jgi:hypothetical protein
MLREVPRFLGRSARADVALVSAFVRKRAGAWPFVLAVFGLSRLLFLVAGGLAVALLPDAEPPDELWYAPLTLGYWANWDGAWYAEIADDGYSGAHSPTSTVFFPLYPMLVRLGAYVLPGGIEAAGVLVSLVSAIVGLFFLYRIAEEIYDEKAARAAWPPPPGTPGCCCSSLWATSGCATATSSGSAGSHPWPSCRRASWLTWLSCGRGSGNPSSSCASRRRTGDAS